MAVIMMSSSAIAGPRAVVSRPSLSMRKAVVAPRVVRRSVVVKASAEEEKPVVAAAAAAAAPAPAAPKGLSIFDSMSFAGPAPEVINGRLAMLGFVAALGAELSSGETVLKQFGEIPGPMIFVFALFTTASLVPYVKNGSDRPTFGPFTANAEMLNGRAAMIGFAALLIAEGVRGAALF